MNKLDLKILVKPYLTVDTYAGEGPRMAMIIAILVHGLLYINDALNGFKFFLSGDRSGMRYDALQRVMGSQPSNYISAAVHSGVVPGEYLLQMPFYAIGGIWVIVLFQLALTVASVVCVAKLAETLLNWRFAAFTCGLAYLFLPQNLVYPHQFVTETTAADFCVFFMYFFVRFLKESTRKSLVFASLCLGCAIFIRPSVALILPPLVVLFVLYQGAGRLKMLGDIGVVWAIALTPLLLWTAIFTVGTGHIGYTTGVANLDWNLRSRVFLVQNANGLPKAPEVSNFPTYESLYKDSGGISLGRFLQIASKAPMPFIKTAITDEALVFGRGNSTKITVDYLGMGQSVDIKQWRNVYESGGMGKLLRWGFENGDSCFVFLLEGACSILTLIASAIIFVFLILSLSRPQYMRAALGNLQFDLILVATSLIFSAMAAAEMVDRAQGKLRHPAEAAMILVLGLVWQLMVKRRSEGKASYMDFFSFLQTKQISEK